MAAPKKARSSEPRNDLTAEYVRSILQYDKRTGVFTWKTRNDVDPRGERRAGKRAGFIHKADGYVRIKINDVSYLAHRLAHLYVTGKWPAKEIDHKKGIRHDNRWSQLREATDTQTACNAGRRRKTLHPFKGIIRQKNGRWTGRIRTNKKLIYLGTYDTPEEAHTAYAKAARRFHQKFARFN